MRRVLPILPVLPVLLVLMAAAPRGLWSPGEDPRLASSRGVSAPGASAVDTVKIRSRSALFPNSTAISLGYSFADSSLYDYDNKGDDGTVWKAGYVQRGANADSVFYFGANLSSYVYAYGRGTATEDNFPIGTAPFLPFVWLSANGLEPGMKVEEAFFHINVDTAGFVTNAANTIHVTAHLDTNSLDYRMLAHSAVGAAYGTANDPNRLAISWNHLDGKAQTLEWSPPLDDRLDWHDFGPRSSTTILPTVKYAGQILRFDVTDAVQQVCDNALSDPSVLTRGLLFIITGHGPDASTYSATNTLSMSAGLRSQRVGTWNKGNPVLTVVATTKRGQLEWDTGRPPLVLTFDDNKDSHVEYLPVVVSHGLKFTAFNVVDWATARSDSLYSANLSDLAIVHHSKTHERLGNITGADINTELELADHYAGWTTPPDTSLIKAFGWPAGAGLKYSAEAIARIVGYNYESARASIYAETTPIGPVQYAMWNRPTNMMAIASYSPGAVTGGGSSAATKAVIKEALTDAIDRVYRDGSYGPATIDGGWGVGAIVVYCHSYAVDGITAAEIDTLLQVAKELNCVTPMNYYDMVNLRLQNTRFIDPAEITVANGYHADDATAAAIADSFRAVTAGALGANMLEVWADVRGSDRPLIDYVTGLGAVGDVGQNIVYWDEHADAATYNVYRIDNTGVKTLFDDGITATFLADTTAPDDSTYTYFVTVVNDDGYESGWSHGVSAMALSSADPLIENFTVNSLADAGGDSVTVSITAGFNKAVDYKLVFWSWTEAEPDTSGFAWASSYVDTLDGVEFLTVGTWPTADADSTVTVTWEAGDPAPTTGYLLDVLIDNGEWAALEDTTALGAADTSFVHDAASNVAVQRGKLEYRAQAVSEGRLSPVTVTQQPVYNDATEMLFRLYIFDGTRYAWSDVVRVIGVKYPAASGGGGKYELQED